MSSIYESTNYNLSYRGILTNNEFKLYTTNNSINVSSEISFDINADYKSSINYFATSILGGIAHSLIRQSKKNNIEIEELEGKIYINLKNPFSRPSSRSFFSNRCIVSLLLSIRSFSDEFRESLPVWHTVIIGSGISAPYGE